ncbi:hydroxymethylglutaryl-CoA synthase [Zopfochytrium polystomum]|nr:hydroxymethylglutaryl-CoA synthase [Zopfochytrium polystomum]
MKESFELARCITERSKGGDSLKFTQARAARQANETDRFGSAHRANLLEDRVAVRSEPESAYGLDSKINAPLAETYPLRRQRSNSELPRPEDVGILAMEIAFPSGAVDMAELEISDGVPGRYTKGLGLQRMSVTGCNQDSVSMAMNAIERLLAKTGVEPSKIGRIDVGTETPVDISKSITTFLTQRFGPDADLEGSDCITACYGGTAAFFNAVAWVQSEAWNGKLAIVVASDVYQGKSELHFLAGAGAVAMLIGPRANVVLGRPRGTVMTHSWDFYRPVGKQDGLPVVKAKESVDEYVRAAHVCHQRFTARLAATGAPRPSPLSTRLVDAYDHVVLHCTTSSMAKRGVAALVKADGAERAAEAASRAFETKARGGLEANAQLGALYTASVWMGLAVLLDTLGDAAPGNKVLMYSFGSGSTAALFELRVAKRLAPMHARQRLNDRETVAVDEYRRLRDAFIRDVHRAGRAHEPDSFVVRVRPGEWYLAEVLEDGERRYAKHSGAVTPAMYY